jgi:hypothetical protein
MKENEKDENMLLIALANQEIKDGLAHWQEIMNLADADQWAFFLEYDDADLFNALYIFNHVAQNIAIKKGFLNDANAEDNMRAYVQAIERCFGFNTIGLTNKVLANYGRDKEEA